MAAFNLGTMLGGTSAVNTANEVKQIPCDMLYPYHNHRFEMYSGERLDDMVSSVKKNGVLIPIVVQPGKDGKYEILIGHNRWNASKLAGKQNIPAIVKAGLSEDEAEMYVIESNLMQRGFNELKITEQAAVIAKRHEDIFTPEKLMKIREELHEMEGGSEQPDEDETENAVFKRLSDNKEPKLVTLGRLYGLSKNSIARLLRVNMIIDELKQSVDSGLLPIRSAVQLSYLPKTAQKAVFEHYKQPYVCNNLWIDGIAMSETTAGNIRNLFDNFNGDKTQAELMLKTSEKCEKPQPKQKPHRIRYEVYSKYFKDDETEDNINDIVDKALAMYFSKSET